jgi:hypothetical protein
VDEVELLDVELGCDDVGEPLDRRALGVRRHHHGLVQRLAELHLRLGASRASELDRPADRIHAGLQLLVDQLLGDHREVAEVDGVGLGTRPLAHRQPQLRLITEEQVGVDLVGDEGRERGKQLGGLTEAETQRLERGAVAVPEAAPIEPHVPVGELLGVVGDRAGGRGAVEGVHLLADLGDRALKAGRRPAVELVHALGVAGDPAGLVRKLPRIDRRGVRVGHPERIGVPEREQELAHRLPDCLNREAVTGPGLLGGEVVPAERIGAMALDHVPGLDHVAAALRHLLPLGVEDQPQADDVAVARGVEEQDRLGEQRVEPAAGLVDRLADEVGGEALVEDLHVLERVVVLRPRHRARVEPGVDDRLDPAHRPLAAVPLAGEGRLVDVGAVEVVGDVGPALAQIGDRAGAEALLAVLGVAFPDRERRSPVAIA